MRVLLISTYELGHQPLHVASPAAALRRAGHEVRCLDLSVQPWDPGALEWTQAVGFSVPMHTAMRLALSAGRRVRREHPGLPICFYGLYATVSRELVEGELLAHSRHGGALGCRLAHKGEVRQPTSTSPPPLPAPFPPSRP